MTVVRDMQNLMRRIVEIDPDVIFIDLENPNRDVLEQMFQVSRCVRRPIAMFVDRSDTDMIEAAVEAGVGAYVVDGLRKERVKAILDMAVSRFNAFNKLREELDSARQALDERKMVERAKGILMKERGLSRRGGIRAAAQGGDEREPAHQRSGAERRDRGEAVAMTSDVRSWSASFPCSTARRSSSRPRKALPPTKASISRWCARRRGRTSATASIVGHFDAAHMLGPMADRLHAGHRPLQGTDGRAVLARARRQCDHRVGRAVGGDVRARAHEVRRGAAVAGRSATASRRRRAPGAGRPPLTFAMVYPFSCHNYELRYWLAACGIDPDRDVRLVVIPPPLLVDAMREGQIDGFCVGEPWNSLAVAVGVGCIVAPTSAIWRLSPEKVLGCRAEWAQRFPDRLDRLVRALYRASPWCERRDNHVELARLLAEPRYVGAPAEILLRGIANELCFEPENPPRAIPDFYVRASKLRRSPGSVMPCGSTRRWCAGNRSNEPRTISQTCRRPIAPTCIASHLLDVANMPLGRHQDRRSVFERGIAQYVARSAAVRPRRFFRRSPFDSDDLRANWHLREQRRRLSCTSIDAVTLAVDRACRSLA